MPPRSTLSQSVQVLLCCVIFLSAGFAWADLVPPEVAQAWQRYEKNPKAFDRTDQYCGNKKPGAACTIPGTVFEGGGGGTCERSVTQGSVYISLECKRSERIEIDRQIPDGPFRVDAELCSGTEHNPVYICTEPPVVADRFCANAQAGQACMAELRRNGKPESHAGVCQLGRETTNFYRWGRRQGHRPILSCEPVKQAPERIYTAVSQWQKLLQW